MARPREWVAGTASVARCPKPAPASRSCCGVGPMVRDRRGTRMCTTSTKERSNRVAIAIRRSETTHLYDRCRCGLTPRSAAIACNKIAVNGGAVAPQLHSVPHCNVSSNASLESAGRNGAAEIGVVTTMGRAVAYAQRRHANAREQRHGPSPPRRTNQQSSNFSQ